MLMDALPRDASGKLRAGCFSAYVDRNGSIIACSDDSYCPGAKLSLAAEYLDLANGVGRAGIVQLGDRYFAVGASMSSGYREYKDERDAYHNDVIALVFVPLCEVATQLKNERIPSMPLRAGNGDDGETVEIATFLIGRSWLGVRTSQVLEALDYAEIADAPDNSGGFVGYLMYRDKPIPVYDVRTVANAGPVGQNAQRQIIVLSRDDAPAFGIVADDLGEVHEVPVSRLQSMPAMLGGDSVLGEIVVYPDASKNDSLLGVLSAERIADRLRTTSDDVPAPMAADYRREQIALVHSTDKHKAANK
jgi:chemotaxis signal transduction protein